MAEQVGIKLAAAHNVARVNVRGWVVLAVAAVEDRPEACESAQLAPARKNQACTLQNTAAIKNCRGAVNDRRDYFGGFGLALRTR
jgi:hypothetical protein